MKMKLPALDIIRFCEEDVIATSLDPSPDPFAHRVESSGSLYCPLGSTAYHFHVTSTSPEGTLCTRYEGGVQVAENAPMDKQFLFAPEVGKWYVVNGDKYVTCFLGQ